MSDYLPTLEEGQFLESKELDQYWLDPTQDYPEPHYLLEFKGVGFSPIGGIQAISGQKKNGKTFVLAQLMAAILNSDSERVRAKLPGLNVRKETVEWLGHEPSVLYVDTEMEKLNSAKVLRRVHWLCGWPENQPNPRFRVLWLREVADDEAKGMKAYERRLELILKAIDAMQPDAVFIDGIRDIIGNFNDNEESASLVSRLMALASNRSICVWSVLHFNPRPGNDTESKMRGHLGTELGNKVSDTFVSVKKKTSAGVTFTVAQLDARGKDVEDWMFEVTDDAGGLGIPRIMDAPVPAKEEKRETHNDKLVQLFKAVVPPPLSYTYGKLQEEILKKEGCTERTAQRKIEKATERGIIEKFPDGKSSYRYRFIENDENDDEAPF